VANFRVADGYSGCWAKQQEDESACMQILSGITSKDYVTLKINAEEKQLTEESRDKTGISLS